MEEAGRQRKLTEKGLYYETDLLRKKCTSTQSSLTKQKNKLLGLCLSETSITSLENERTQLDIYKEQLNQTYNALNELLDSEEDKESLYRWFDLQDREFNECRQRVSEKIHQLERNLSKENMSVSKASEKSVLSINAMRAKATAKAARLEIEMAFFERESEFQKLQIMKEIAMAKAEVEAMKGFVDKEESQIQSSLNDSKEILTNNNHVYDVTGTSPSYSPGNLNPFASIVKHKTPVHESIQSIDLNDISPDSPIHVTAHTSPVYSPGNLNPFASIMKHETPVNESVQLIDLNDISLDSPIRVTSGTSPLNSPSNLNPHVPSFRPKLDQAVNLERVDSISSSPKPPSQSLNRESNSTSLSESTLLEIIKLQTKQAELSAMMVEEQKLNALPKQEPPMFNGSYFDYPIFIRAFETIIESKVVNQRDRLYFLNKYTSGKAHEIIKGFITLNSDDGYNKAKSLLAKRFGDPHRVSDSYKIKLKDWPRINEGDSESLQSFSDFLGRCEEAMKTMEFMNDLDSSETLKKISAKLPSYVGVKWCRHAFDIKERTGKPPKFHDLSEIVRRESNLATDPIFSPDAYREERKRNMKVADNKNLKKRTPTATTFSTSIQQTLKQGNMSEDKNENRAPSQMKCPLCNNCHDLEECAEFKKKSLDERREFVKIKHLCFGCLSEGHVSKQCRKKRICKECNKTHPTSLHMRNKQQAIQAKAAPPTDTTEAFTRCNSSRNSKGNSITNCMIIPVLLHHESNVDHRVKVYALLDNASDTTFVKLDVLKELGVSGVETQLNLYTMSGKEEVAAQKVNGLVVTRPDEKVHIELPKVYTRDRIPSRRNQIPTPETAKKWSHLQKIADKIHQYEEDIEVGLLIGSNCPKAIKPRDVILGKGNDPYAVKTLLGWGIIGPVIPNETFENDDCEKESTCNRILTQEVGSTTLSDHIFVSNTPSKEVINPYQLKRMFEMDFSETERDEPAFSQEDKKFMAKMEEGIVHRADSHYQMPLPFKDQNVNLPNNKALAQQRLNHLKRRFERDNKYKKDYFSFMNDMIKNGHAERVTVENEPQNKQVWYIPHHGVYHPKKPDKIRVVFDCSAKFKGESLNTHLLQGPDLTNNLVGVLCRFRQEPVAFICDIEGMFHQVFVTENCRDFLRFLWWEDENYLNEPVEFRMTVHLFGASSSPGCANFALKQTAHDNEEDLGSDCANFLRKDFYVDDGLKSVPSVEQAVSMIKNIKEMCRRGGFNLHKFSSNKKEVIKEIPLQDRAKNVQNLDLDHDVLPIERTLGVQWHIESDAFQFQIILKDRPCTRRGILSTVSSIFDPLGFVAPLLLTGKAILQDLCRDKVDWDDPVPERIKFQWEKWRTELLLLKQYTVPRCFKPDNFGTVSSIQLHHFSDASTKGYGQCSYLRMKNDKGEINCSFLMGKARVTPLKPVTIPRLELTAAVVSVRVSEMLQSQLRYENVEEIFWSDSKVVLGYISNETRRFHVFVANRVQQICSKTSSHQWRYVDTKSNPADDASRGLGSKELIKDSRWITGPEFLWKDESHWPKQVTTELVTDDPEIKAVVLATKISEQRASILDRLGYFSDWYRAIRAFAICCRFKTLLQNHKIKRPCEGVTTRQNSKKTDVYESPNVEELHLAEMEIIKLIQKEAFGREIQILQSLKKSSDTSNRQMTRERNQCMKGTSSLYRLDPFLDSDGIVRVGGRITRADLHHDIKHPIVLPKKCHITELIIKNYHQKVEHQGRGMTLNEIRSSGYWIIGGSSAVGNHISNCIVCRKLRGSFQEQKMADLPEDRLEPVPPFTYSAVDYFGPWYIKEGRKELKRYGVLFTCMVSRAVHIETSNTMETDSFINALRRFICRRGPVRQLRSDQGSNFIGAKRELREALEEFNSKKIHLELSKHNCDWIEFKTNVPHSSHMGGVWERQIRTVRGVMSAILHNHGMQLDDESLRTFLCEAEAIVNSRPLTTDSINDPKSLCPLTPNHLLTMKSKVILQPPGIFDTTDVYSRKRWRRVQHIANEFWSRWRKEFLLTLQQRQRWTRPRRNLHIGDIVLVKDDDFGRNQWPLARIMDVYCSKDGHVRSVKLNFADSTLTDKGERSKPVKILERPIHKLVLLIPCEEMQLAV